MKVQRLRVIAIGAMCAAVLTVYQNCSSQHTGGLNLSSDGGAAQAKGCQAILQNAWQSGYRGFTKTNCGICHTSGPGSGFFASDDTAIAFQAFSAKGEDKISQFAVSTHKPPNTGPQLQPDVTTLKASWASAQASYNACMSSNGGTGGGGGSGVLQPTKMLVNKPANPANNATVTLTWNLQSETVSAADAFNGQLVVTVRAVTFASGVTGYQFENLRLVNNSGAAAYVKTLNLYVDDALVDGETYLYVDRYVPAVANNNTRRLLPGAAFLAKPLGTSINVKFAFSEIKAADIDFRPVTYAALTAAGGIFATSCATCHGTNGGLSLAANNFANVVGRVGVSGKTLASPYNLGDSEVYQRMSNAGAPMPTAGLLPKDQIDRVRDWILDGAPSNDAAIAR